MYLGGLKKGNTFINSGEQDCDFEYFSKTYTGLPKDSYMTYDIDNDGNLDLVSGDLYYNSGDGYTFNEKYINSSKFLILTGMELGIMNTTSPFIMIPV